MPRLLILTQYFPPEMGAPQARLSELAERLTDTGWQVQVLTAVPNYPTGRVLAGYSAVRPMTETMGRLEVMRVPLVPSRRGFVKRLGTYFSFAAAATVLGPRLCDRPDLMLVESPPLFIGYAARALSAWWRCPFVFNVSDLWPESAIRMGVVSEGLATRQAERLEKSLYRAAAGVTGQSQEIIDGVLLKAPGTRTELITNGVDPARFGRDRATPEARQLLGPEAGPIFVYAGLLGHAQGLDQILDLAARLPASVPGRFVLVGDGPVREQLARRIENEGLHRVKLVGAVPRERIPALLGAADGALITLGMAIPGAIPSKIYEAMASELPIVLVAEGEAATRVVSAGAGVAVAPGDATAFTEAFVALATDAERRQRMGRAGRRAAETLYDRSVIAKRLDAFLRDLLTRESGTASATP